MFERTYKIKTAERERTFKTILMETRKRWQNFLLTNFVRREKKMAKILQAVKKDDKNLPSFLGF